METNGGSRKRVLFSFSTDKTFLQTATLYPSIVCGICLFLNLFIWGKRSSGAVPFTTMLAILLMWFGISFPLVCLGFYFGYRKQVSRMSLRNEMRLSSLLFQSPTINPFEQIKFLGKSPSSRGSCIQSSGNGKTSSCSSPDDLSSLSLSARSSQVKVLLDRRYDFTALSLQVFSRSAPCSSNCSLFSLYERIRCFFFADRKGKFSS